jgi:tRNA-2-methylthio-N6-dimethylallyladenosine synthase
VATDLSQLPSPGLSPNGYFKGRVKANVSIMEGCDNYCSYCIVPYVRGREMSRRPRDIMKEVEGLVSQGVKEVTLLGQNVNSYYSEEGSGIDFPKLIRMIGGIKGLIRMRFTTSHPKDVSKDLFRAFSNIENLCPHIHLPFQAGSNRVLKLMNRGYSRDSYMALAKRFREIRKDFALTSDVMVGFPGETEEDFKKTLDLIEKIEFDNLFSFKYSDRKGTRASQMENKVGEREKSNRLKILQEMQKIITLGRNKDLEGKIKEVLIEGKSKRKTELTGRTGTNKIVNFTSDIHKVGELVNVKIKHGFINSLQGEILKLN